MRFSRLFIASVVSAAATLPAAALAQAPTMTGCDASGSPATCSQNKNASTTVTQVLGLMIKTAAIDLQATDSAAYEKTFRANNNTAGTPGSQVTTAATLQDADVSDSVVVFGNRPYKATLQAADDYFQFEQDGTYAVCRASAANPGVGGNTSCVGAQGAPAGKSSKDVYVQVNPVTFNGGAGTLGSGSFVQLPTPTDNNPIQLKDTGTSAGGRFAAQIKVKSAWFYATDIPGTYTATLVYTITGQ